MVSRPDPLEQAREKDGRIAEPPVFPCADVPFGVPERVEHADQSSALTGEIVKIEQLESADAGSAQRRFDLLFVTERLELPGSAQEIAPLVEHAVLV